MKRVVVMYVMFLSAVLGTAQQLNTSAMSNSGQSGASEESRYVLGLVKNGRADLLNKYFDQAPWKIQTEIDVYKNAAKEAAVSVFCVAVDLGNVDVVKAFVNHGLGPADLCRVQTFTTQKVIVSKADRYINESSSSSSKTGASGSYKKSWFRSSGTYKEESTTTSSYSRTEEYHQVAYGEKKVVKTYFANPLDFASDEMFDYLWSQGFRSNNLFTVQALADAKATGKREVYDYILANKQEMLATKPFYISEETYAKLLDVAKNNPDSLAAELLVRNTLGKVKSSQQAQQAKGETLALMTQNLSSQVTDTVGYSAVMRDLANTNWQKIDQGNAINNSKQTIHNQVMRACKGVSGKTCRSKLRDMFPDVSYAVDCENEMVAVYSKPGTVKIFSGNRCIGASWIQLTTIDTLTKRTRQEDLIHDTQDVTAKRNQYAKQGYSVAWTK